MKTIFNKQDLTDFANYCLSAERNNSVSDINKNNVTHADFQNWKYEKKINKAKENGRQE